MKVISRYAAAFATAIIFSGTAQAEYPERDILGVIMWGAGGGTDKAGKMRYLNENQPKH